MSAIIFNYFTYEHIYYQSHSSTLFMVLEFKDVIHISSELQRISASSFEDTNSYTSSYFLLQIAYVFVCVWVYTCRCTHVCLCLRLCLIFITLLRMGFVYGFISALYGLNSYVLSVWVQGFFIWNAFFERLF